MVATSIKFIKGSGTIYSLSSECGRYDGLHLLTSDWKAFTEEIKDKLSGQMLTHSFYLWPKDQAENKEINKRNPALTGQKSYELQEQKRKDMLEAGWKELIVYKGNHCSKQGATWDWNSDPPKRIDPGKDAPYLTPYYMCLMGLLLKENEHIDMKSKHPFNELEVFKDEEIVIKKKRKSVLSTILKKKVKK